LDKDTSQIPKGYYCYRFVKGKNKYGIPNTESCPYLNGKEINGVVVPWCEYLEKGGIGNDGTKEDWQKLIDFFGSEDALFDALPLTLLFDSVKNAALMNIRPKI
jgi:hypothetical protein